MQKSPLVAVDTNFPLLLADGDNGVLNSILLVSNDSHLLTTDHRRLGLLFRELDLPVPLIVSPREIVQEFYR